jgi:transcriptional regulator with XRE-family HTH domain
MRETHQEVIGATIARLRDQQGWSQRALAKWVGLDQSAVSRIEAGHRRLSADELQRFARALHVTTDDLLPLARPSIPPLPPTQDSVPEIETSPSPRISPLERDGSWPAIPVAAAPPQVLESSGAYRMARRGPEEMFENAQSTGGPAVGEALSREAVEQAAAQRRSPLVAGLPDAVAAVAHDWFSLRQLAATPQPAQRWSTGHSAEGKPERLAHTGAALRPGAPAGEVLYDRVARFWRSELHVEPDDGPLPDLLPLLEDGYGVQVVVARVGRGPAGFETAPASEQPVAAAFSLDGVPFIFVNAARPVVLQRFALAHAFAHHVLGHGDVVDQRVEWSRNVPPEAAANDFTEEFLAPVRAVERWYERRDVSHRVSLDDLLELANAFGISAWSALFRSRAAGRLQGKQFHVLRTELERHEWELLPRQAYLGGLRDTLSHLTPGEALPPGAYGGPAVLRVPAPMRAWTFAVLREGRLSLEEAAAFLRTDPEALAGQLARLGLE